MPLPRLQGCALLPLLLTAAEVDGEHPPAQCTAGYDNLRFISGAPNLAQVPRKAVCCASKKKKNLKISGFMIFYLVLSVCSLKALQQGEDYLCVYTYIYIRNHDRG